VYRSARVKLADGNYMVSDRMVKNVEWWDANHMFRTNMRVLPLSAFDAVLGYEWLRRRNPMECVKGN
jgi:hypothetical protein